MVIAAVPHREGHRIVSWPVTFWKGFACSLPAHVFFLQVPLISSHRQNSFMLDELVTLNDPFKCEGKCEWFVSM